MFQDSMFGDKLFGICRKTQHPAPYSSADLNEAYNLMFCDDLSLFVPTADLDIWLKTGLGKEPEAASVKEIAEDERSSSHTCIFAYRWLREKGEVVPLRKVLRVIVEVALPEGLDVVAAYCDGSARYLNHSEKSPVFVQGPVEPIVGKVRDVLAAAQPLVDKLGTTELERLPPPQGEMAHIRVIASGGICGGGGGGRYSEVLRDPLLGPILSCGYDLMMPMIKLAME